MALREFGEKHGWPLFAQPKFPATTRDGWAMMALAAQVTGAESAYAGGSGDTVVYCTLRNLRRAGGSGSPIAQAEEPSPLEQMNAMIAAQVNQVQLPLSELRRVESLCRRAYDQMESGYYSAAVTMFDAAWQQLGAYAADQEPAGWLKLAKGNALALDKRYEEAIRTLTEADRLHGCPDQELLYRRLGQCRLAMDDRSAAVDLFVRCYVAGGRKSFDAPSIDRQLLDAALQTRWASADRRLSPATGTSPTEDPQLRRAAAIVDCLISDLHDFEIDAHERDELARKERAEKQVMCEADWTVRERTDANWCWLMATWCTPGRLPRCGSWGSPPEHDPNSERISSVARRDDGTIDVETTGLYWGSAHRWRYELVEYEGRLLVRQLYSRSGEDEYPMI